MGKKSKTLTEKKRVLENEKIPGYFQVFQVIFLIPGYFQVFQVFQSPEHPG